VLAIMCSVTFLLFVMGINSISQNFEN
jgi:hypothetical protein